MDIQHLTGAAGGCADEVAEQQLIRQLNLLRYVAVDVGLRIAGIKHIAVGILAADQTGHGAVPDAFVDGGNVCRQMRLLSGLQRRKVNGERRAFAAAVNLMLRQRRHV